MGKQTQRTKVYTNEALRTCEAIVQRIEDSKRLEAYLQAVKAGHVRPWEVL